MKKVISASRRTDLVSFFPEWLASAVRKGKAVVYGPSGHVYTVDLQPDAVHTLVLWSKDFSNLIGNRFGLKDAIRRYSQVYFLFTITGLGGTFIEKGVPHPKSALAQLEELIRIAGNARRVSVRFDPIVFWKEGKEIKTNLHFFEELAPRLSDLGIKDVRFSFTQWYGKAVKRAEKHGFSYLDPSPEEKKEKASSLAQAALRWGLNLYACSQSFLTDVPGIKASSCINAALLQSLHPDSEPTSRKKDRSQRKECGCTGSVDIGSYAQKCPHSCLYCYANPRV